MILKKTFKKKKLDKGHRTRESLSEDKNKC